MGYVNEANKLLSKYESSHDSIDYENANKAYWELIAGGTATTQDLLYYAVLQDYRSRDYVDKAIELYKKAIDSGKVKKDEYYYKAQRQLIALLSRISRAHESIEKHKSLLQQEPDNVQNYILLTMAYYLAKQYDDASSVVEAGLKIDSDNAMLLTFAGDISKALGKYSEAFEYWERSYDIEPEGCDCLYSAAFLYQELGMIDKAINKWNEIIVWNEKRGYVIEAEWPRQQLLKLQEQYSK